MREEIQTPHQNRSRNNHNYLCFAIFLLLRFHFKIHKNVKLNIISRNTEKKMAVILIPREQNILRDNEVGSNFLNFLQWFFLLRKK